MEVKTEVPVNQEDEEIDVSSTFDVVPDQSVMDVLPNMEKEADPEEWAQNSALPYVDTYLHYSGDLYIHS